MGKPTDLSKLTYARFAATPGVRPLKRAIRVFGFDSETGKDGNIIVLACSDGAYELGEPVGDILRFLTKSEYYGAFNFFYNLGFDHNALFKSLCEESMFDELVYCGRTEKNGFVLDYVEGKMLKIKKNGRTWKYFDISKFYKGGGSGRLVDVYAKVFNKPYSKIMDASKEFKVIDEDVIKYCVEDAKACQELSENLVIPTNMLVPMSNWYSGATIAKNMRKQNLQCPYIFKNSGLQQFAMYAYGGARIEVFKRGTWGINDNEKMYMYDIRSAYPSVQCQLYDVVNAVCDQRPEYMEESLHSFFKINVKIEDCVVGPLKYRFDNVIFYPYGRATDIYVDKNELELLMEYDVDFDILEARHDMSETDIRPYAYLADMYEQRLKYKKSSLSQERQLEFPLKLALNSSYGMLIERTNRKDFTDVFTAEEQENEDNFAFNRGGKTILAKASWKAGAFFNPVHACEVTSAIRCKLYRDSEPYQKHLIKYATDSMTFDRRIKLDFGDKLGQYEDSPDYYGLVIGCGVYSMVSEGKKVNKFRSFDSQDLIDLAIQNGDKAMVEIIKTGPVKLREAKGERYKWFNTFQEKRKRLDINFDHRREWEPPKIKDFNSLMQGHYDSKPREFCQI